MIEYLRYEPDSTVSMKLREKRRICFRVDERQKEMEGAAEVLARPRCGPGLVVFV